MILESRSRYASSAKFRDDFIDTLTPGIIPRSDFINWNSIVEKTKIYDKYFEFFRGLRDVPASELRDVLRDSLLADDAPLLLVSTAFQLLGHTGKTFASVEDFIDFKVFGEQEHSEEQMEYIANLLITLGIGNVLNREIDDYFLGVQVGLESHRRKNVGGKAFIDVIRVELAAIVESLKFKGHSWELKEEEKIYYKDGKTSKKVDFLLSQEEVSLGIEVNFYTASGSKPTEIKRSYGQVNKKLDAVGTSLVWITDGAGYYSMKNSLKEARDIHKNIYNLNMVRTSLEADLMNLSSKNG